MTTPPNNPARRPLIGVTTDREDAGEKYSSWFNYAKAVELAGGLPVLLPYKSDVSLAPMYFDRIDGLLLTGGSDLDPALFGETYNPNAHPIDPDRQRFELALLTEVELCRTPALGVCLGSQVMNVHRGGSLHQYLPELDRAGAIEHRKMSETVTRHAVQVDSASRLGAVIGGPTLSVNSYHKQAVNRLGRGLRVIATAPDGVIEGIEDASLPLFAAVQWHPERLLDEPGQLAPFQLLVDTASRRGE